MKDQASEILMNYSNGHNSSNTWLLILTVVFFRNVISMVHERVLYFTPRINLFNIHCATLSLNIYHLMPYYTLFVGS